MNNETLDIIQEMLGLIRAQSRRVSRLEAHNALLNCALVALLENTGDGREPSSETIDLYRTIRASSSEIGGTSDEQEQIRSLLRLMDSRFPSLAART